jgi:hypothetical protein
VHATHSGGSRAWTLPPDRKPIEGVERGYHDDAEFATGERLASADFEGGKTGAVKVLEKLGFSIQPRRPAT